MMMNNLSINPKNPDGALFRMYVRNGCFTAPVVVKIQPNGNARFINPINDGYHLYTGTEELRLNNVYGLGDIYHHFDVNGINFYVKVGRYDLRDGTEEYFASDEDAYLTIATEPDLGNAILRAFGC